MISMTKDEYWQKFSKTGLVTDYLAYKAVNSLDTKQEDNPKAAVQTSELLCLGFSSGEDVKSTYAGFNTCNRNDS